MYLALTRTLGLIALSIGVALSASARTRRRRRTRGDAIGHRCRDARDGYVEVLCDAEGSAGGRVQAECAWRGTGHGSMCV